MGHCKMTQWMKANLCGESSLSEHRLPSTPTCLEQGRWKLTKIPLCPLRNQRQKHPVILSKNNP
jgi:hypothetical protein